MVANGLHWTSNTQILGKNQGTSGWVLVQMESICLTPEQHTQYLAHVGMHVQPSSLEVHEEKVHNNVYASAGAETTRYRPQFVSTAGERGATNVMERRSQYVGRRRTRIFPNESRGDHDGARLSRIRIFLRAGGPRILCLR